MSNVFLIMFSAILSENLVLFSFLGIDPFFRASHKPSSALALGGTLTVTMTLASAAAFGVNRYLLAPFELEYLKTAAFVLIIVILVQIIAFVFTKIMPSLSAAIGICYTSVMANCAVLGGILLNVHEHSSFVDSVAFGFASAIGFTLASVIFAGVRAKLEFSEPSKAFKGFPILLIAAGLVALAFMGFLGMSFN